MVEPVLEDFVAAAREALGDALVSIVLDGSTTDTCGRTRAQAAAPIPPPHWRGLLGSVPQVGRRARIPRGGGRP